MLTEHSDGINLSFIHVRTSLPSFAFATLHSTPRKTKTLLPPTHPRATFHKISFKAHQRASPKARSTAKIMMKSVNKDKLAKGASSTPN